MPSQRNEEGKAAEATLSKSLEDIEDPGLADLLEEWGSEQFFELTTADEKVDDNHKNQKEEAEGQGEAKFGKTRAASETFSYIIHKKEFARQFEAHIAPHVKPTIAESIVHQASKGDIDQGDEMAVAFVMVDNLTTNMVYQHELKKSYRALFKFLGYIILVLLIVCWQSQFFTGGSVAFKSMRDQLFGTHRGVVTTEFTVNDRVSTLTDFTDYINDTIVSTIFDEPICGDDFCSAPEEYPKFSAASDARVFRGSCEADCGTATTTTVTVDFFDVWKLKNAYTTVRKALASGFKGISARQYSDVVDTNGEVIRAPMAGWNICSKTDYEQGFFTPICIFDADSINGAPLIINGLPYRTSELDDTSTAFGGSKTLELYSGDWELRIAFTNFTWTHYETNIETPIAFPAVRGKICINQGDPDQEPTCEIWSPCPNALECNCEYYQNEYLCYDESGLTPDGTTWNEWRDSFAEYPKTLGTDFTGQDMIQNYVPFSTFQLFNVSFGDRDDDGWGLMDPNTCLRTYTLQLGDTYGDGFNGAEFTITRRSDEFIVATGTQLSTDEVINVSYGLGFSWSKYEVLLCPEEESYIFEMTPGDWPLELGWALIDASDSVPTSGAGATIFDEATDVSYAYRCILFGDGEASDISPCSDLLGIGFVDVAETDARALKMQTRKLLQYYDDGDDDYNYNDDGDYDMDDDDGACSGDSSWIGDGFCDIVNNNEGCGYDGGDCCSETCSDSDYTCGLSGPGFICLDPIYTTCTSDLNLLGDGKCDAETNREMCYYDLGDCCELTCVSSTYNCGTNGFDCLDPFGTLAPTMLPSKKPTYSPTLSMPPSQSPTSLNPNNDWGLPNLALLSCSSLDDVVEDSTKCSKLEYIWSSTSCSTASMGDGRCDKVNNHLGCAYDAGDCCQETCVDSDTYRCADQEYDECYAVVAEPDGENPQTAWPYYVDLVNDFVTTYPHAYAKGVLDIVSAQQNYKWNASAEKNVEQIHSQITPASLSLIPSTACGDCSVYDGEDYLSVPFTVTVDDESKHEMFPTFGNDTIRERYFSYPNRVLGGVLMTQLRQRSKDCRSPPFNANNDAEVCLNYAGDETYYDYVAEAYKETSPFGTDPTFVDTTSLYRATNKAIIKELYDDSEINQNGIPYAFFADSGANAWNELVKTGCDGLEELWLLNSLDPIDAAKCMRYPVLYDINFNRSKAFEVSEILTHAYLDGQTGFVGAQFATYNVNTRTFYYFHTSVQRMASGEFRFNWEIKDVVAELYTSTSDHVRFGIEIVFLITFFYLLSIEVKEYKLLKKKTNSSLTYFLDAGNMVDLANYAIVFVCIVLHIVFFFSAHEMLKKARYHYDVYQDYNAVGRVLQMERTEAIKMTRFFREINKLAELRGLFENMLAIYLILVCIQLIKNLSFHPYLGVVSHTLYHARNDMLFFLFLLISVNVIYAFLGTVLFGSTVDSFATFVVSLSTSVTILSGVYSPLEDTGTTPIALVYFWSNTLLNYFLLFNFLLAIVVDAYQKAKADTEANPLYHFNHDPFFEMLRDTLGFPIGGRCHLPDRELLHALLEASIGLRNRLTKYNNDEHISGPAGLTITTPKKYIRVDANTFPIENMKNRIRRLSKTDSMKENDRDSYCSAARFESDTWRRVLKHADDADSLRIFIFPRIHKGKKSCVAVNQHLVEVAIRKGLFLPGFDVNLTTTEEDAIKIIAYNFMERFGYKVDKNNDGFLSDDELDSIRNLLDVELQSCESEKLVHAFVGQRNARLIHHT